MCLGYKQKFVFWTFSFDMLADDNKCIICFVEFYWTKVDIALQTRTNNRK